MEGLFQRSRGPISPGYGTKEKKCPNALAIQVDAEGKIKYDAIARQGQSKDKVTLSLIFPPLINIS